MCEEYKIGEIRTSGGYSNRRWWVLDRYNPETEFMTMTALEWSPDCINEPGVMYRTNETIRFKNKGMNGEIHNYKAGGFYCPADQITIKSHD